jgi:hypothetical protein
VRASRFDPMMDLFVRESGQVVLAEVAASSRERSTVRCLESRTARSSTSAMTSSCPSARSRSG